MVGTTQLFYVYFKTSFKEASWQGALEAEVRILGKHILGLVESDTLAEGSNFKSAVGDR